MNAPHQTAIDTLRPVRLWLWTLFGLVFVMVLIGGITRLTGSGLSMVEWRPLMGTLPPLSDAEWSRVFAQYQQSPQYLKVNAGMTLGDFKFIFFWEYFHRLFGRLIGVAFLVPWLWFLARRRLTGRWAVRTGVAFVLGGLQGALGWFMVKSGLVDVPAVSHYRLAAHLLLAFAVAQYLVWLALEMRPPRPQPARAEAPRWLRRAAWGLVGLICLQIVYGAFMAGKAAGWMYSTFPTMHGEWVPGNLWTGGSRWRDLLDHPPAIHFVHRLLGWLVALATLSFWALARRRAPGVRAIAWLPWLVLLQFGLGVATVVFHVPTSIAVAHQGGALVLLTAAVAGVFALRPRAVAVPAAQVAPAALAPSRTGT